eukprot:7193218-Ditylum_brightwellii.AAC.1
MSWKDSSVMFEVGETVEYVAGKDSDLVMISAIDESLEQNQFIVTCKSNMPFNVDPKMLRRVVVPDAGKIPSEGTEIMQTSRGFTKEQ